MVEVSSEPNLARALKQAIEAAKLAGEKLRDYLENPSLISLRDQADQEAEVLIRDFLTQSYPQWGFRAEEEPDLNELVSEELPFWLVDPNDGTSAFLRGERGASVSIALIWQGRPVLGVVYAYAAPNGLGDLFTWAEGASPLSRNGIQVKTQWSGEWSNATIFISNSADQISHAYQDVLSEGGRFETTYRVAPGVAYRLALCAVGEGEVAISLASPRDFDFAAGHALLRGAGGTLVDERGREITYLHQRPFRLGFAFGGDSALVKRAAQVKWKPIFEAQRSPQKTPFLSPRSVTLCSDSKALNLVQGAWWGWHIGWLHQRHELQHLSLDHSRDLIRREGGDQSLILEARSLIEDMKKFDHCDSMVRFIEALESMDGRIESIEPVTPIKGVQWGAGLGRRSLPHKIVSAFLGWRGGTSSSLEPMKTWQPDGDRLIEELLSTIPRLRRAIKRWEERT